MLATARTMPAEGASPEAKPRSTHAGHAPASAVRPVVSSGTVARVASSDALGGLLQRSRQARTAAADPAGLGPPAPRDAARPSARPSLATPVLARCVGTCTCGGTCHDDEKRDARDLQRVRRAVAAPTSATGAPSDRRLARAEDRGATKPPPTAAAPAAPSPAPPAAPTPAAPKPVCGPDVTAQVGDVVKRTGALYARLSSDEQDDACKALENLYCGPVAWDIVELHNNAWILDYRPACASAGASPKCGSSVQVGTDCHFAGSVNYVIFGKMCKLCDMWKTTMHLAIRAHKQHLTGVDADYEPAVAWADAGYHGWPAAGVATPPGDRKNCTSGCPTAYGPTANNEGKPFALHWFPAADTETVGEDCERWIKEYRAMKTAPPPDYIFDF